MTAERWLFSDESDWLPRLAWVSVMTNTLQYKGYSVNIEYSAEDKVLYGKIDGIGDLVTFESENVDGIEGAFHNAVDDYLAFCEQVGKVPEKTYKGIFNVRIDPSLHRAIATLTMRNGTTRNQAVEQVISQSVAPHH